MKKINEIMMIYLKSLTLFWKASPIISLILVILIPTQAIIPSTLIWLGQVLIDSLSNNSFKMLYLFFWALIFCIGNLINPIMTTTQGVLTDKLISSINLTLMRKSKDLKGLMAFEDSEFYDDLQIISSESSWRPVNLIIFGINILRNTVTALSMGVLLARYNLWLSILILVSIIPQAIITYKIQQESFETMVTLSPESRRMQYYSDLLLTKYAAKEIRVLNLFDFFIGKYKKAFKFIHKDITRKRVKKMAFSIIFIGISSGISIFSLYWFIKSIQNNSIPIGALLIFTTSIIYINQSLSSLIEESSLLYDTLLYMKKYFGFINIESDIYDKGAYRVIEESDITFKHVYFTYQGNKRPTLKDINFTIKQGEKIAIVGENGAGKSTLIKLLLRFYDIDSGEISMGDNNIVSYDIEHYRHLYSVVFQDFAHFSLSIRDNIIMGNLAEEKNIKRVEEAAQESGFSEVLNRKKVNYTDILGKEYTSGIELSGGEWQKLTIAKAFFSGRKYLILDEPTASLDPRSEYDIFQNFLKLSEKKTVIFITHRLAAVKLADRVLVLKNGEIHGLDSHESLLVNNEYYRELYEMQASGYINN